MTEELKRISTLGLSVKFIAEWLSSDGSMNQCLGHHKFEGDGEVEKFNVSHPDVFF